MFLWSLYGLELHRHRHAELMREAELHRLAGAGAAACGAQRSRSGVLRRAIGAAGSGLVAVGRQLEHAGGRA